MDGGDLVSLLIWVALGIIGVVSSAIKSKAKRPMDSSQSRPPAPHSTQADPQEYEPDLGSLLEMFDMNKPRQPDHRAESEYEYESVETGASVEEGGWNVDTKEAAAELEGLTFANKESVLDTNKSDVEVFEEGQSDIQKMIAKYESLRKELDPDNEDDIASGEIVSVEAAEAAEAKRKAKLEFFDPRKAIIYSEILKRREY